MDMSLSGLRELVMVLVFEPHAVVGSRGKSGEGIWSGAEPKKAHCGISPWRASPLGLKLSKSKPDYV